MPCGAVDLTPLLYVSRLMEMSLFFLLNGLLLMILVICYVDLPIFLLLLL
jgi:hypothetical protein